MLGMDVGRARDGRASIYEVSTMSDAPDNLNAPLGDYFDEGLALMDMGDYNGAVVAFTKALRLTLGDMAEIHLHRGMAYVALHRLDEALQDFNQALEHSPYFAEAYCERGAVWHLMEEYAYAVTDYGSALRLNPQDPRAYMGRAMIYERLGQWADAVRDYTSAITHDRSIARAYEGRGRAYRELGDYDGAIADFQRYLRMGGGREYDNHSETQSLLIVLQMERWLQRIAHWVGLGRFGVQKPPE